ncbi:solute:Na+ symporter, SSS family [Dethiosulfatibacter aminovorans DSM 17477]|uniref:Solute:Na+ symporter, SSS family n=1 Tax=Dethiosulfatibacter aminovorans DSM 17477 TaxID=1121476 RepID=A0A1M6AT31_9FIRM|nr:sodium:solute symporter family protein [Dethiosulfatibacter aminovorans]SHI39587.1 solute:Na+ symporter, SSS family [Dethiosulfatibacter aminovorans DSM 17477]
MGLGFFDMAIIVVYFISVLGIGFMSSKKIDSFDDYAVAGRQIPTALLFATMAATATGGGATIGRVSYAYHTGIVIFFVTIGFVLNQVLTGVFIAPKMREMGNIYTVGDIMGYYYGKAGRLVTGIFTFVYSISIFGVQILAMGKILQTITGFGLIPLTVGASAIVVLYTWAGGMWAVIYTDAVQFIVLATGITMAALLTYSRVGGGDALMAGLDEMHLSITAGWPMLKLIAFFLTFLLGEALAPFYVQRYLTTKDPGSTRKGVTLFGLYYGFFTILAIVIGLAGVILLPDIDPDMVMSTVVKEFLPTGVVGIVFGAMLAAIMSTGDSILNNTAVIFTRDIYHKFINEKADNRTMLKVSKLVTIIVGAGGIIAAITVPSVMDLMIYTYYLWAPSIIPPIVIALLWGDALERKVSPYAGLPAIVSGMAVTLIWGPIGLGEPMGVPALIAGIIANLIVFSLMQAIAGRKTATGYFKPEDIEEEVS